MKADVEVDKRAVCYSRSSPFFLQLFQGASCQLLVAALLPRRVSTMQEPLLFS